MFFHPSKYLYLMLLILSILMNISSNSWFSMWLSMEINMMMFIPIIMKKKSKYDTEMSIKYFLVQTIFSMILLTMMTNMHMKNSNQMIMMLMLGGKMAVAPLHKWLPTMSESLNWVNLTIMLTLQKINPMIIYSYLVFNNMTTNNIMIFMSATMSVLNGLNQMSLRKIMIYSSINQMAWILSTMSLTMFYLIMYFMIYCLMFTVFLMLLNNNKMNTLNDLMNNKKSMTIMNMMSMMSLSGLPPFTGFLPKMIVINEMMKLKNYLMMTTLMMSTLLMMFVYMRINIKMMTYYFSTNLMMMKKKKNNFKINMMNIMIMIVPSLFL